MKRVMSQREEQVYRLRHHAFSGLSPSEAAKRLGMTVTSIGRILKGLKKKAPQLFPILTCKQADIYYLYVRVGLSRGEIVRYLNISCNNFATHIERMRQKGVFIPWQRPPMVQYVKWMHDHRTVMKF